MLYFLVSSQHWAEEIMRRKGKRNTFTNDEVFGKCANENWHGHNFELYVTIKGEPDPDTGFIFDAKKLGALVKEKVTEKTGPQESECGCGFYEGQIVFH